MDFSFTAEDEAFRDELRAWLDVNLPKFLESWDADDDPGGGQVVRLRPHPGAAQGLAAPAQRRSVGGDQLAEGVERSRGHAGAERDLRRRDGAGARAGHLQRERHLADRPDDHQVGHARSSSSAGCRASSTPTSTGARASASPRPAPTSRTCARWRSSTATRYVVNGQKTWISSAHLASGACSCCAPTRPRSNAARSTRASPRSSSTWRRPASSAGRSATSPATRCSTRCSSPTRRSRSTAGSAARARAGRSR